VDFLSSSGLNFSPLVRKFAGEDRRPEDDRIFEAGTIKAELLPSGPLSFEPGWVGNCRIPN
jgi:hypothetical protein